MVDLDRDMQTVQNKKRIGEKSKIHKRSKTTDRRRKREQSPHPTRRSIARRATSQEPDTSQDSFRELSAESNKDSEKDDRDRNRDKSRSRMMKHKTRRINKGNTSTQTLIGAIEKTRKKAKLNSKHAAIFLQDTGTTVPIVP